MARLPPGLRGKPLDWGDDEAETRVQRDAASLSLIAREGPANGHIFGSDGQGITIGRGGSCAVRLALSEISRRHALIRYHSGRYWVEDLGTLNGTRVNGLLIDKSTALKQGDRVRVGAQEFEVRFDLLDGRQVVFDGPNSDVATSLPPSAQQAASGRAPARPLPLRVIGMIAIGILAISSGALLAFAITRQSRRAASDAAHAAQSATARAPAVAATAPPPPSVPVPVAAPLRARVEIDDATSVTATQAGTVAWAAARGAPFRAGDDVLRVRTSNAAKQRELDRINEQLEDDDSNPELGRRAHAIADELMSTPDIVSIKSSFDGVVIASLARGTKLVEHGAPVRVARRVRLLVDAGVITGAGSACRVVFVDQKLDAEGRRVVGGPGATIELTRFPPTLALDPVGRIRAECK